MQQYKRKRNEGMYGMKHFERYLTTVQDPMDEDSEMLDYHKYDYDDFLDTLLEDPWEDHHDKFLDDYDWDDCGYQEYFYDDRFCSRPSRP